MSDPARNDLRAIRVWLAAFVRVDGSFGIFGAIPLLIVRRRIARPAAAG